jgi:hypothetical protein
MRGSHRSYNVVVELLNHDDGKQESFRAYLDESEEGVSGTYAVGGFVARAEVWEQLLPQWQQCLPKGIANFHATDCFSGNCDFSGLNPPQRMSILDKATDVLLAHEIKLIGYGIDSKTYRSFAPKAKHNDFLGNKYAAPFGGAVELACEAMGNSPTPDNIWDILDHGEQWERCAFYIEQNEYSASAARTIDSLRESRELWWRHRIGAVAFCDKKGPFGSPLLQVADFGAFLSGKRIGGAPDGKIPWSPYYEKLKHGGRIYRTVIADEYSLNRLFETHQEIKNQEAKGQKYFDDV